MPGIDHTLLHLVGRHLEPCVLTTPVDPVVEQALQRLTAAADTTDLADYRQPLDDLAAALTAGVGQPEASAVAKALMGEEPTS